ncbi:hypothetical protein [Listeria welshimeri]|nr:hypothetical protein [Listeria welshimeri]
MGTRVMYPIEVKKKTIQMKKENIAVRVIMKRNKGFAGNSSLILC